MQRIKKINKSNEWGDGDVSRVVAAELKAPDTE